jgi:hypothetical protein
MVEKRLDLMNTTYGKYPDGIYDDVDFYYAGNIPGADCDNDGTNDDGISDSTAEDPVFWWQDGVDQLGTAIIAAVGPGTTYNCEVFFNGTERHVADAYNGYERECCFASENWEPATYKRINHALIQADYWTNLVSGRGPRFLMNLFRIYTLAHPLLQESHSSDDSVLDNKDFRLNYALTLMVGGVFGMTQSSNVLPWWDEFSANPAAGYVCTAFGTDSAATVVAHSRWMGRPKGRYVRHYNESTMGEAANISGLSWASANPLLNITGMTASYVTTGGPSNGRYGRYIHSSGVKDNVANSRVAKSFNSTAGTTYAVIIQMRSDMKRDINTVIQYVYTKEASGICTSYHTIDTEWRYYVYVVQATGASTWVGLQCGTMGGELHIAKWLVIPGNAGGFSRDFDRALALANISNEDFTFTLPSGARYKKLTGTQDPTVNDGSVVSGTITIPALDGLILGKVL